MSDDKLTASGVVALLRERYSGDTHVTLEEVRDAAGYSASRSCDVISIGTWPSRGLVLRGFEVKVARADWKRELEQPEKAEAFAPYCDEWYIAAGSSKIVQLDELPPNWGLMVAKGSRLECVKPAVKNEKPEPVDRGLLVALLKRAKEQGPTAKALEAVRAKAHAQGKGEAERALARETGAKDVEDLRQQNADLLKRIAEFERASGLRMMDFRYSDPTRLGNAVRAVLHGQVNPMRQQAAYILRELERVTANLKELRDLPDLKLEEAADSAIAISA